jgi:hypothetical protein
LFLQELTDSAVTPSATTDIAVMTLVINLLRVIVYENKKKLIPLILTKVHFSFE